MEKVKTLGEKRVRTDFNITSSEEVDKIKQSTAKLINYLEAIRNE